ncbi:uncharacterized protein LOC114527871 [Dendronephthya gigantea]|uniref:uncharacterized protein LOC114527871 n=1 Tax=Dendronephthya gigantea TaxID=151771 RepID=UPI00106AFAA4|nr:uncharacterized protein LOC114527871 [Dendronephthya gigantea]
MVFKTVVPIIILGLVILVIGTTHNNPVYVITDTENINQVTGLSFVPPEGRNLFWSPCLGKMACRNTALFPIIDALGGSLVAEPSTLRCFRRAPRGKQVQMCNCSEITISQIAMLFYNSSSHQIIDMNQPSKKMCLEIGKNNAAILSPICKTTYILQPRKPLKETHRQRVAPWFQRSSIATKR